MVSHTMFQKNMILVYVTNTFTVIQACLLEYTRWKASCKENKNNLIAKKNLIIGQKINEI